MKFHLDKVDNLAGFSTENAKSGETVKVMTRALITSDDPEFYPFAEQISSLILTKAGILIDNVHQFLIVIHNDLSADLYVNEFSVSIEIRSKRDIKAGEAVMSSDIVDIRRVKFNEIEIKETDRVIYCFKAGWRFGIFFDLTAARSNLAGNAQSLRTDKLDVEQMELSIGELRRYLTFYHVYKTLESEQQFTEMQQDGWFPFIEILGGEYKDLSEAYKNKFDFENKIKSVVDRFDEQRIKKITNKWWKKNVFTEKKSLIEAGINAYLQNTQDGFINCIKNLWTEIEGILRRIYHTETGKGDRVKSPDFVKHIIEKARSKSSSEHSLLLPLYFLKYLEEVAFASFNVEKGNVPMSRPSSSHGVANAKLYTKERSLQLILILDQIYFYD